MYSYKAEYNKFNVKIEDTQVISKRLQYIKP